MVKTKIYLPTREWTDVELDEQFHILPNFRVVEIANNLATEEIKLVIDSRAWVLLTMLQLTRNRYGSMNLNSVYRTSSYNKKVGGDPNSAHLRCWAFDWAKPGQSESQRKEVADWWKSLCFQFGQIGAINYYTNGYHCEIGSDVLFGNTDFKIRDYRGTSKDW